MKVKSILPVLLLALVSVSCNDQRKTNCADELFSLSFPEEPVTLFDNSDAGKQLIAYYNIVQVSEDMAYMYFAALEEGVEVKDFNFNLYFACSEDLVHWKFTLPDGNTDNKLMDNIIEQSVCYLPGDEYPFRLVGNIFEDDRYKLCMWFSKDGLDFGRRKVILEDRMHDSQCVLIPTEEGFKLYFRQSVKLGPGNYDRRIVLCHLDREGDRLDDYQFISGHYLYNSSASKIDDRYDLMLPTFFNNAPGMGDSCRFTAYVQDGLYSHEIDCPLNAHVEEGEKWFITAPGILYKDGRTYVAYNTRNTSHDEGRIDVSTYKLVEIKLSSETWPR